MSSIEEVAQRLIPLLEATINLGNKNPRLHPIIKAVHDMQMAAKWLHLAVQDVDMMANASKTITIKPVTSEEVYSVQPNLRPPTLLGALASFNYIEKGLTDLNNDLSLYKDTNAPGAGLKYKLDRTYDRLIESQFNIELARFYYEQLNGNTRENTEGGKLV